MGKERFVNIHLLDPVWLDPLDNRRRFSTADRLMGDTLRELRLLGQEETASYRGLAKAYQQVIKDTLAVDREDEGC